MSGDRDGPVAGVLADRSALNAFWAAHRRLRTVRGGPMPGSLGRVRIIAVLAVFIVVLAAVLLVSMVLAAGARRRRHALQTAARWAVRHYAIPGRGHTVVAVALTDADGRIHNEHVVARIPDGAQDWQRDFIAARQEAEERAFHLNSDRPPIEG